MKKLTFVIISLFFIVSGMSVQAQGFRHNRMGSYIGIGFADPFFYSGYNTSSYQPFSRLFSQPFHQPLYQSFYQPFPSASLINGINYRNYNSRMRLHNRAYNGRAYQRSYRNGFEHGFDRGYSKGRRSVNHNYQENLYTRPARSCYEVYYDRNGNRVERSLPASACRH